MKIRKARKEDLNEIVELEKGWEKERISWGVKHSTKKDLLNHIKKDFVYIAEIDGKPIGYGIGKIGKAKEDRDWAGLKKRQQYGWIDGVYVKKSYRKRGFGKLLMKNLLKDFQKAKIKLVLLKADSKELKKLINFYERLGFKEKMADMVKRIR